MSCPKVWALGGLGISIDPNVAAAKDSINPKACERENSAWSPTLLF